MQKAGVDVDQVGGVMGWREVLSLLLSRVRLMMIDCN